MRHPSCDPDVTILAHVLLINPLLLRYLPKDIIIVNIASFKNTLLKQE